jgi:hypothetical protein
MGDAVAAGDVRERAVMRARTHDHGVEKKDFERGL